MNHKTIVSLIGASIMLGVATPAHAYLDPATGSIMIQAVIGAVAGGTLFFRAQLYRLKTLFGRKKAGSDSE